MTTFLQYLVERLMGPSEFHKGEQRWTCPWCGHRGFHIRPDKPEFKPRWSCWHCGQWGDEFDLIAHFRPRLDYGQRLLLLDDLRREWETAEAECADKSPGSGMTRYAVAQAWSQIDRTLHDWEASSAHAVQTIKMALEVCHEKKVNVEEVVAFGDGVLMLEAVVASFDAAWDRRCTEKATAKTKAKGKTKKNGRGTKPKPKPR